MLWRLSSKVVGLGLRLYSKDVIAGVFQQLFHRTTVIGCFYLLFSNLEFLTSSFSEKNQLWSAFCKFDALKPVKLLFNLFAIPQRVINQLCTWSLTSPSIHLVVFGKDKYTKYFRKVSFPSTIVAGVI